MLDVIGKLLAARMQVANGDAPSVTISLPLDDPRSQKIKEIAQKLLIRKTTIRKSGLQTTTGLECPDNADRFLKSLREELGDELMGEIETDLLAQIKLKQSTAISDVKKTVLDQGQGTGQIFDEILRSTGFKDQIPPGQVEKMGNLAQELLKKNR